MGFGQSGEAPIASDPPAVGAYGFRIVASDAAVPLPGLVPVSIDAPLVRIRWRRAPVEVDDVAATDERVVLSVKGTALIEVERETSEVSVAMPHDPTPEAIVHPVATTALAALARWRGLTTLHAGAVVHEGRAYAICGTQHAGKSSTLASFAAQGLPVVADDLLVLQGGRVFAGPRCIDLRADAAARFPGARALGVIGARERFRLPLAAAPALTPLAGVFLLAWSDSTSPDVDALTLLERASLVHTLDYAGFIGLPHPEALLDLLELPMWRVGRPATWEHMPRVLDAIIATAAPFSS